MPLLHLWAFPIPGPVISDNVNDLVESPPEQMIGDMQETSKWGRTRQLFRWGVFGIQGCLEDSDSLYLRQV